MLYSTQHKSRKGIKMIKVVYGDIPDEALAASRLVRTVGMDIETSQLRMVNGTLDKTNGKIAMIQVYIPDYGTIMVRNITAWPTNLTRLLEGKTTKIFHYASFDLYFLMRDLPLVYPTNIADTKVAANFYDPKKTIFKDHRLNTLVSAIFGYEMDKSLAVSDWLATDLTPAQLEYAAKDVEFLPELLTYLEKRINTHYIVDLLAAYRFLPQRVMIELKVGNDVFAYK